MSRERREQERFCLNLNARIQYRHHKQAQPTIETVAANISRGGAFLATEHSFPMASKVEIEFLLDLEGVRQLRFILDTEGLKLLSQGSAWVKITGVVIRRTDEGVGIIFDKDPQLTALHSSPPD